MGGAGSSQPRHLDSSERAQFRAWFERFDTADWDRQLVQDVETGTLDWLAEEALADLAAGHCRGMRSVVGTPRRRTARLMAHP